MTSYIFFFHNFFHTLPLDHIYFCPCNWNIFYLSVFQFDGVHVVSGSLDTSIRVWDAITGTCKHTLMGHQSLTSGMELRQNILVSGNADSTVKVWDTTNGQCLQTLSGKKSTYKLNFIVITNLEEYFFFAKINILTCILLLIKNFNILLNLCRSK